MSPYLCPLPPPFLTQRPEGFLYNKLDHGSPLFRDLRELPSYRKSQNHCGLKALNDLEHAPSLFICLMSPLLYSPPCCGHSSLLFLRNSPSMLLLCSLCLEYSSHRHLHGSFPRPPSGVSLNECFILLFFENSRVRYFLIQADHLSWHVPFLFPDILLFSPGASRVYLLVQVQLVAKVAVVLLLLILCRF